MCGISGSLQVVFSGAFLALWFLLAPPQAQAAENIPCTDDVWENCRRDNLTTDQETIGFFANIVEDALARIVKLYESDTRISSARVGITLSPSDLRPIFFQTQTISRSEGDEYVIRTSVETLSTLSKINIAIRVAQHDEVGIDWLAQYLLFLRKNGGDATRIDPLRALGLIDVDGPIGKLEGLPDIIKRGIDDSVAMLTYLIAHELYHVKIPFVCFEIPVQCNNKKRSDEIRADLFAIETLSLLFEGDSYYAHLPSHVFTRLAILLGEPSTPRTHPHHVDRVRQSKTALVSWATANGTTVDGETLKYLNNFLRSVDEEGIAGYFSGLDEEAIPIAYDDLKLFERD